MHNQEYTLSVPTSAGAGLWDAAITYTGFDANITALPNVKARKNAQAMEYDHAGLATSIPFGALMIRAGAAGTGFTFCAPVPIGDTAVAMGSFLGSDRGRLIAVGFEVHNTTAEIYRQGSVTVGALPSSCSDAASILYRDVNAAPWIDSWAQADHSSVFASTRAVLAGVPTSSTWPASKGCYVVPRMIKVPVSEERPVNTHRTPIVYASDGSAGCIEPIGSDALTTGAVPSWYGATPAAFGPVEAYFSGLSNQTTLTIKLRTIVEYFPAVGSTLLPLATPSTSYDVNALTLYSRVARDAPYAVPVSMNAAGDYFRNILSIVRGVAPAIAPLLGGYGPIALGVGALAGGIERAMLERAKLKAERDAKQRPKAVVRSQAGAGAMPTRR